MKCFVSGATGLVGRSLTESLLRDGHEVVALSRGERASHARLHWVQGDVGERGDWMRAVDGCDAVFHLAGEPIASGRWTEARKRRLVESRVESTRHVVDAIGAAENRPRVLVCASAVGYYGSRGEEELREDAAPGEDFLARLCVDWEAAAGRGQGEGTRVVMLRIGIVLDRNGGALEKMLPPFRLGLGGPVGPPSRWFPWVHLADVVGLARLALERPWSGPINVVAPGSVRMRDFAQGIGRALGRPAFLPVPLAPLRVVLGEFASYLSPGQKVVPAAALDAGYAFEFPDLSDALQDCVG